MHETAEEMVAEQVMVMDEAEPATAPGSLHDEKQLRSPRTVESIVT